MNADFLLVLCTCPDHRAASVVATALLEKRLAACVNQVPGVRSLFRWKGRIEKDDEVLLLIKTTVDRYADLEETILKLHPYELPEIIGVPLTIGSEAYFDWIRQSTQ